MKSARAAIAAARNVVSFPTARERRERDELAFLPGALEIVETPPSPVGRAVGATIVALLSMSLIWAAFGQVDIVASASGRIVPLGGVKLIQPFETSIVRAIDVRDGQHVKAGDVLVELDPTMTKGEEEHIRSDFVAAELEIARLRAALSDNADPQAVFDPPAGASAALIAVQRQFLAKETEEYRAKLAALDGQRRQKQAESETIVATIQKLEAVGPIVQQHYDILQTLNSKGLASKLDFLEVAKTLTENQKDLGIERSRLNEANAALAAIVETRDQEAAEFRSKLFAELAEAERKAGGLRGDLAKAEERTKLQLLTAPVDGTVQQLSIHTVGGVVTPAQQLGVVVPAAADLEVEAMISIEMSALCTLARMRKLRSTHLLSPGTGCFTAAW